MSRLIQISSQTLDSLRSVDAYQPRNYKKLHPEDCMTVSSLIQQNYTIHQNVRMLQFSAPTVSQVRCSAKAQGTFASVSVSV